MTPTQEALNILKQINTEKLEKEFTHYNTTYKRNKEKQHQDQINNRRQTHKARQSTRIIYTSDEPKPAKDVYESFLRIGIQTINKVLF